MIEQHVTCNVRLSPFVRLKGDIPKLVRLLAFAKA